MCLLRVRRLTRYLVLATLLTLGVSPGWLGGLFHFAALPPALAADAGPEAKQNGTTIQHIDLVHLSHTDVGFTDHPIICREMQRRYLDIAIDAVLATRDRPESARFYWTAESTIGVNDWWQSATPERRADFLKAVDSGQLAVAAIAMNNTAFLNGQQWHKMLHWLPEDLWKRVNPTVAMQDDVNGVPRAGAMALLDRGVHRLLTGMNTPGFQRPLIRPSAIWWKMPDGRRLFVYLGYCYPSGFSFFDPVEWRHGPVPLAGDTRFRPPRPGDILASDEASVRKAHRYLLERLRGLEAEGYRYPTLLLPITNQWRIDNDPPFPAYADFVATWKRLGLKPTLSLTTAAVAMKRMEDEIGAQATEYAGEWPDWWSFGTPSAPREVAASRIAKRLIEAADSPLWGPWTAGGRRTVDELLRDLCLFDEHTWGSANSVALPDSLDTQGQFNEKAALAFRPMVRAEWLLSQRVRSRLVGGGEGLFVANSTPLPWSGWIRLRCSSFREDDRSMEDTKSGGRLKMYFERGFNQFVPPQNPSEVSREDPDATFADNAPRQIVKFWAEQLPGQSIRRFKPSTQDVGDDRPSPGPKVTVDAQGWPTAVTWPGMTKPLCLPGLGDFVAVRAKAFAPRFATDFYGAADPARREKLRREVFETTNAAAKEKAAVDDNPHTLVFTQFLSHPRLKWITRQLEVWKGEPRAKLTLRLNRTSSEAPETFYVVFPFPCESAWPETSCGDVPFVPIRDQLPGTCRDYYGIDGWIHYATPAGHWIWVSRDAPLVSFGGPPQMLPAPSDHPEGMHRVLAMIFDNFWYTNFVGDSHGVMEFRFDMAWRKELPASVRVADVARTLASEPQVMINPALKENPIIVKRLYEP
jgi:hypothetical protein